MINDNKKIGVLDFGGQYAHLIASRIRRLGAYSEIVAPESLQASEAAKKYSGLIFSGGPSSVYDAGTPRSDAKILSAGIPILGICYGHQLMMQQSGARIEKSSNREYGPAELRIDQCKGIFRGEENHIESQVWMSHGDEVVGLPPDFEALATTPDCAYAAVGNLEKNLYGLQFHPEVTDTERGGELLRNFINLCGLENSWSVRAYLDFEMTKLAEQAGDKNIFFLISGGVDSTVAYTLLARAVSKERLRGLLVDTGFMREGEIAEVRAALNSLGVNLEVRDASREYFAALKGIAEPEQKRNVIGELFVDIKEKVSDELGLNPDHWLLGQGTIYPDRIESGATKNSAKIKTHHNRVGRIEKLIAKGQVIEPISELYKDEVRNLGREMGLPDDMVDRHPFPGPGLAVRCLCLGAEPDIDNSLLDKTEAAGSDFRNLCQQENLVPHILPINSVGVQGDKRSYARPLSLFPGSGFRPDWNVLLELARIAPNRLPGINRVLYFIAGRHNPETKSGRFCANFPSYLSPERMGVLRRADHIVHTFQKEKNIYNDIWQFPTVLVPVYFSVDGSGEGTAKTESIILRPVNSMEAMTATAYQMDFALMHDLALRILDDSCVDGMYYDLTSKPPGTIEWE